MIEIYTAGAAEARKKDMPDPPGGYGFAAYNNRKRVYTKADQITLATPNVTTITENLAELMAFTRGLQWARRFRDAPGTTYQHALHVRVLRPDRHGRLEGEEA